MEQQLAKTDAKISTAALQGSHQILLRITPNPRDPNKGFSEKVAGGSSTVKPLWGTLGLEAGKAPHTWTCRGEHRREAEKMNQSQLRCQGKIRLKRPSKVVPAKQGVTGSSGA